MISVFLIDNQENIQRIYEVALTNILAAIVGWLKLLEYGAADGETCNNPDGNSAPAHPSRNILEGAIVAELQHSKTQCNFEK